MPDFIEEYMPIDIAFGSSGGPMFSTDVITVDSGRESRVANWSQSRGAWNLRQTVLNIAEVTQMTDFFHKVQGKAVGFRFKDWTNFIGTNVQIGVGTGTLASFQIVKVYGSFTKDIKKIVNNGTLKIYVNGVLKTLTTHYTINYNTGIITFTGGNLPTAGQIISASYEFDFPVRFDTDQLEISLDSYNNCNINNLPIVELKL